MLGSSLDVVNMIVDVLDFGMDRARTVDAARVEERTCCVMNLGQLRVPQDVRDQLDRRKHRIAGGASTAGPYAVPR